MRLAALAAMAGQLGFNLRGLGAGEGQPDPWTIFGQLGASGILATVLWIQLGKAEKRADAAEARAIAALQETVPVLALATERLSDKVSEAKVTSEDVTLRLILDRIDKKLGG